MSVSVYGEYKEKNMMQSTAGWDFQRNEEIPDTPEFANLDAWRAHLKSEGKEDPLAHLNAADRVAYVDCQLCSCYSTYLLGPLLYESKS